MTTEIQDRTEVIALPLTFAAIRREFPGKSNAGLRARMRASALHGGLGCIDVAFTACGLASLSAVRSVLDKELADNGWDKCLIAENEFGQVVAHLDQRPY